MAAFLSQDEIDSLLDITEDVNSCDMEMGEVMNPNDCVLGIVHCYGATSDECLEVKLGNVGYIVKQSSYSKKSALLKCEIVAIRDTIVVLLDTAFNTHLTTIGEIDGVFYKSRARFDALKTKSLFDEIIKLLGNDTDFNVFVKQLKDCKENYPELWI